jgi:F420-non-reducing hydrogenase iron-sulfur subunit
MSAFSQGADGVLIGGCHPGDCHYIKGNYKTKKRVVLLKRMLDDFGIEKERFRLEWISASEGNKVKQVINEMVAEIKKLGPSPIKPILVPMEVV